MTEEEFWAELTPLPKLPTPTYRLYYNEAGEPLFYSMEDLAGKYIEVTRETYINPPTHIRVVDGKLVILNTTFVTKLTPSTSGTPCHPTNVSIVVTEGESHTKWTLK